MQTPAFELTIRVFGSPDGAPFISCIIGDGVDPGKLPALGLAAGRSLIKLFGGEDAADTPPDAAEPLDDFPPPGYPGSIFKNMEGYPDGEYD